MKTLGWHGSEPHDAASARTLFASLAKKHGLEYHFEETESGGVECILPEQPRLSFQLRLGLWDEVLLVSSDFFMVEFWTDLIGDESPFVQAVSDILSGRIRMLCRYGRHDALPYHVILQRLEGDRWLEFKHYRQKFWRWRPRTEIIRNIPA